MKLTEREKALLYVLGIVTLVIGGIYFVLIPQFKAYEETKLQLEESLQKQMEAQALLDRALSIDGQLASAKDRAIEASEPFLEQLDKEHIDRWLHQIAQSAGVEIISNTMSDPIINAPQVYRIDERTLNYPIKEDFEISGLGDEGVDEEQVVEKAETNKKAAQLVTMTVQLSLGGTNAQVIDFIHGLNTSGIYLRVEQFGLGNEAKTLYLTLYMIEKQKDPERTIPFPKPAGKDRVL